MKSISLIVFLITLLSLSLFAEEPIDKITETSTLTHGIKLIKKEYRFKGEDHIDHTDIIISQNDKIIDTFSSYKVSEIYKGDIDNDGITELILQGWSGGAHCCFDVVIIPLIPDLKKVKSMSLVNSTLSVKDIDNDGKSELIMQDDCYSYFESLCFACSPRITVAIDYSQRKLTLNPELTKQLNNDTLKAKLYTSNVSIDSKGTIGFDDNDSGSHAANTLSLFLYYLYTGQHNIGVTLLDKYFTYDDPAFKRVLYTTLISSAKESIFWNDIKKINNFTSEQLEKMKYPKKSECSSLIMSSTKKEGKFSTVLKINDIVITLIYPQSIKADEEFTVTAKMLNEGKNARMGGLTLSFPQLISIKDAIVSKKFDTLTTYTPPQKMYNSTWKENVKIDYFVIEGWETKWKSQSERFMKIKLKAPHGLKSIDINVRGVLIRGKGEYKKESINPASSSMYDQQGYAVKQVRIEVTP